MSREFQNIGVIGLGTRGAGIAEVLARNGLAVIGVEVDEAALERGRVSVETSTARAVAGGKLTEGAQRELLTRITYTTDLTELSAVDLVIEAVPEQLALKCEIFPQLDTVSYTHLTLPTKRIV